MSQVAPSTASWQRWADDVSRRPVWCVQFNVAAKGSNPALTVRIATKAFTDPNGFPWDPLLAAIPTIDQAGAFLESSLQLVDCDISVFDRHLSLQPAGDRFSQLCRKYDWARTPVLIYFGFLDSPSWSDFQLQFTGEVSENRESKRGRLRVHCVQSRRWNVSLPPKKVNTADWPEAPTESIGAVEPIVYGKWTDRAFVIADPAATIDTSAADAGIMRGVLPCVSVERIATGKEVPTMLVTDHKIKNTPSGQFVYLDVPELGRLAVSAGGVVGSNPSGGPATFQLSDRTFFVACVPVAKNAATTAVNWDRVLRQDKPRDLSGSALCSGAGSILRLACPALGDGSTIGRFVDAYLCVWYRKNSSAVGASKPRYGIINNFTATNTFFNFEDAATAAVVGDVPSGFHMTSVNVANGFTVFNDSAVCDVYVDTQTAGHTVNVCNLLILLKFVAQGPLIGKAKYGYSGYVGPVPPKVKAPFGLQLIQAPVYGFDSALLHSMQGRHDETGEQTGAAGTLLEHPIDMIWHLLRERGGVASGEIDTSSGPVSFPTAKAATSGYRALLNIGGVTDVEATIRDVSTQFGIWFIRGSGTANAAWQAFVWGTNPPTTYRRTIALRETKRDSFQADTTLLSLLRNSITVRYDWDPYKSNFGKTYTIQDGASISANGKVEAVLDLYLVSDDATAHDVASRMLSLRKDVRALCAFEIGATGGDIKRGDVLALDSSFDAVTAYPRAGSDGSWAGKPIAVTAVSQSPATPSTFRITGVGLEAAAGDSSSEDDFFTME